MGKGLFKAHTKAQVTFDTKPAVGDMVWIDRTTGLMYNYDNVRGKWLSAAKHMLEYARKGASDGMYLPLLGDLDDTDDVYMTGQSSVIVNVFCRSRVGNKNKGFEIHKNGEFLFEFNYDGSSNRRYSNTNLDFSILPYDMIQLFVKKDGPPVRNTVCRIETAWRYDV